MKNESYSKMAVIVALILVVAMSSWFALPAALCYAQGGYGVAPGGEAGEAHPGFTSLSGRINTVGALTEDVTAQSPDDLCQLVMNKETTALNKWGIPLSGIIMVEMKEPPAPPPNAMIIGLVYDLGPQGANFDPPITLTFTYDPALLPEGASHQCLALAMWDEASGEWVILDSTVDPNTNTVTAQISHFTAFAILASITPATFTVTDLSIVPSEAAVGSEVTISALVNNTGCLCGSYELSLKINGVVIATREVTLAGSSSQVVTFTTTKDITGTYTVNINNLQSTFVVKERLPFEVSQLIISPAEVTLAEEVTISAVVTNTGDTEESYTVILKINGVIAATRDITLIGSASQEVTFTTTKDVAGTYTVDISGQAGNFVVRTMINWWLIGGIIGAVVAIAVLVWYLLTRRRVA